jgi:hypothetical protein
MATTTPNMGLTKPDPDGSVGTWDTELNATIDLADAHDHTTGKGVKVPVAGLNINADLSFAGFGATGVKVVDLAAVLASEVTGYPTALFCNSADNELYWRTSGGVNVQITSGASLNAALLGGFTGDYGSGGSQADFNSGTSIFNFLRAANHRAFIDSSDIRLFQGTSGITNAVKLRSPNSLAASYDWIFPTALPASQKILQITSGGQVVASATAGTTIVVPGGSVFGFNDSTDPDGNAEIDADTDRLFWKVPLPVGKRWLSYRVLLDESLVAPPIVTFQAATKTGTALTLVDTTVPSAGDGSIQTLSRTLASPITLAAGTAVLLRAVMNAVAGSAIIAWVEFTYDEP